MKKIITVCGAINPQDLGKTSMHDHVLSDMGSFKEKISEEMAQASPINVDEKINLKDMAYFRHGYHNYSADNWDLTDFELMKQEVSFFNERGESSILEPSAPGISHDITLLKKISSETRVNIIASTGLYVEPTWPEKFLKMNTSQLMDFITDEINNGIRNTDIKPGHIKSAIRSGTEKEYQLIEAAARVSNETGYSITTHTSRSTPPEKQRLALQTLKNQNTDLSKVIFCHIHYTFFKIIKIKDFLNNPEDISPYLDWAKEIMDAGGNICIDLFGYPLDNEIFGNFHVPDIYRLLGLYQLIQQGYEKQIVVGCDVYQKSMTRTFGGHGYSRILDFVAPQLAMAGIKSETIDNILIHNPARILSL